MPAPFPLLEKKLEWATAVTGMSTAPVPMNSGSSEAAFEASSVRANDSVALLGGMKCGSVTGSIDDQVPLGSVMDTTFNRQRRSRCAEERRDAVGTFDRDRRTVREERATWLGLASTLGFEVSVVAT